MVQRSYKQDQVAYVGRQYLRVHSKNKHNHMPYKYKIISGPRLKINILTSKIDNNII